MRTQFVPELPEVSAPVQNGAPALLRKKSSPMMPPFMVSAPGKVIVYGEHAVVHGKVCSNSWDKSKSG
jgi:mevalonate kinase